MLAQTLLIGHVYEEDTMSTKELEVIVYPLSSVGVIEPSGDDSDDIRDRYNTDSDRLAVEPGDTERRAYWCREQFI